MAVERSTEVATVVVVAEVPPSDSVVVVSPDELVGVVGTGARDCSWARAPTPNADTVRRATPAVINTLRNMDAPDQLGPPDARECNDASLRCKD